MAGGMPERVKRIEPWIVGAVLLGVAPGLVWAPRTTWAALTAVGLLMLARVAITAAGIGLRSTMTRAALGASLGPWIALVDRDVRVAEALEISFVAALVTVWCAPLAQQCVVLRREGLRAFLGLSESRRPPA